MWYEIQVVELWVMWSATTMLLLLGSLGAEVIGHVKVSSMSQIDLF